VNLAAAALSPMLLAADPITDPTSPATYLTYGPLGLIVIGFVTGQIVTGKQAKRLEDENDRMRKLLEEKVIPLVQENTRVTEEAIRVLADLSAEQRAPRRRPPPIDRDRGA
jgi:hypothetical protein